MEAQAAPKRHAMEAMAEDIDARIGRNMREIRMAAGLSIDTLACRTGLQPATLALHEAGRRRIPVEVLTRLAAVLGRQVADFFV